MYEPELELEPDEPLAVPESEPDVAPESEPGKPDDPDVDPDVVPGPVEEPEEVPDPLDEAVSPVSLASESGLVDPLDEPEPKIPPEDPEPEPHAAARREAATKAMPARCDSAKRTMMLRSGERSRLPSKKQARIETAKFCAAHCDATCPAPSRSCVRSRSVPCG